MDNSIREALIFVLSPTRFTIEIILSCWSRRDQASIVKIWNKSFLLISTTTCLIICAWTPVFSPWQTYFLILYAWILPLGRVNELVFAFWKDSLDRLNHLPTRMPLKRVERIQLLMRSYVETALNFGLLYYVCSVSVRGSVSDLYTILDAIYFSVITLATVGYGDIKPALSMSRFLTIYESLAGIVFVVLAVATYIGHSDSKTLSPLPLVTPRDRWLLASISIEVIYVTLGLWFAYCSLEQMHF
jgi:hypothetical protein